VQEELINKLIEQAKDYDEQLLTAGLTVLSKDLAEYLASTGRIKGEPEAFLDVYASVMDSDRSFEAYGSPLFLPLEQAGLPKGFAQAAAEGKPDLSPLGDRSRIVHEWTFHPGKKLFEKFKAKFKETICGKDGPYEQFQNKLLGQAGLPATIVTSIIAAGFSVATVMIPLLVYFALLLVKAGLKTYCE
jgi:hypothetical protein